MSDDLRTRIATAVWMRHRAEAFTQWGLDALSVPEHPIPNWAYGMADAVIRELNLSIAVYYKTPQGREVCVEGYWTEESNDD